MKQTCQHWPHLNYGERFANTQLARLRLGCSRINADQHHRGLHDTPVCAHCDTGVNEDRDHYLLSCAAWQPQRQMLWNELAALNVRGLALPCPTTTLLGGNTVVKSKRQLEAVATAVMRFVNNTGRMRPNPADPPNTPPPSAHTDDTDQPLNANAEPWYPVGYRTDSTNDGYFASRDGQKITDERAFDIILAQIMTDVRRHPDQHAARPEQNHEDAVRRAMASARRGEQDLPEGCEVRWVPQTADTPLTNEADTTNMPQPDLDVG